MWINFDHPQPEQILKLECPVGADAAKIQSGVNVLELVVELW